MQLGSLGKHLRASYIYLSLIKDWNFEGVLPIKIYTCKKVFIECQDRLEVFSAKDVKFEE